MFTGRFGLTPGEVLFDRICRENGIRHLLTAPHSPTTTGKVERFHKTLREGCVTGRVFATVGEAQAAIDRWVQEYNTERPHQSIGDVAPLERFRLAPHHLEALDAPGEARVGRGDAVVAVAGLSGVSRFVDQGGQIHLGGFRYHVGRFLAGGLVEVVCRQGLVEIVHRGVLVATHAQRRPVASSALRRAPGTRRPRAATVGSPVIRLADATGSISFAGTSYRVGRAYRRRSVEVSIVAASVQLSVEGKVVRVHPIRHDRTKEHGAFATPRGRPRKPATVA